MTNIGASKLLQPKQPQRGHMVCKPVKHPIYNSVGVTYESNPNDDIQSGLNNPNNQTTE